MCTDPERRQAVGIPGEVRFATKPHLALEMIAAALDAGVEAPWVTGDEAYGQGTQLRAALEARKLNVPDVVERIGPRACARSG